MSYTKNTLGMIVGEGRKFELRRARRSGSISSRQQNKVAKYIRRLAKQVKAVVA